LALRAKAGMNRRGAPAGDREIGRQVAGDRDLAGAKSVRIDPTPTGLVRHVVLRGTKGALGDERNVGRP
jgi:hypothetical protein